MDLLAALATGFAGGFAMCRKDLSAVLPGRRDRDLARAAARRRRRLRGSGPVERRVRRARPLPLERRRARDRRQHRLHDGRLRARSRLVADREPAPRLHRRHGAGASSSRCRWPPTRSSSVALARWSVDDPGGRGRLARRTTTARGSTTSTWSGLDGDDRRHRPTTASVPPIDDLRGRAVAGDPVVRRRSSSTSGRASRRRAVTLSRQLAPSAAQERRDRRLGLVAVRRVPRAGDDRHRRCAGLRGQHSLGERARKIE